MAAHLPPPPGAAWRRVACGGELLATERGLTVAGVRDAMDVRDAIDRRSANA